MLRECTRLGKSNGWVGLALQVLLVSDCSLVHVVIWYLVSGSGMAALPAEVIIIVLKRQ